MDGIGRPRTPFIEVALKAGPKHHLEVALKAAIATKGGPKHHLEVALKVVTSTESGPKNELEVALKEAIPIGSKE